MSTNIMQVWRAGSPQDKQIETDLSILKTTKRKKRKEKGGGGGERRRRRRDRDRKEIRADNGLCSKTDK